MTNTDATNARHTKQRGAIQEALRTFDNFATAQQIHSQLRSQGSKVGLATVYRTLQAWAGVGELDVIRTWDGQVAYRICSPGHHHHLICRECGRTVEVAIPSLEDRVRQIATQHGFSQIDHELEFYGLCATCATNPTESNSASQGGVG